jgi:prophage DNA circulation protein
MQKQDTLEATPIMQRSIKALLAAVPNSGSVGANFRTACSALIVNAQLLIGADLAGPPLQNCFALAQQCGATQAQLASVRNETMTETPITVGGAMIQGSIIETCLATEGQIIANMTFTSREDVDALKDEMNDVFAAVEETLADAMDQMSYRAVIELHAAVIQHLVATARPLPRLVQFAFNQPMPTLLTAMRLYSDASRADELRDENKVVHPAFELPIGVALSS